MIVTVEKEEKKHVAKLEALFTLHGVLQYPVSPKTMTDVLV